MEEAATSIGLAAFVGLGSFLMFYLWRKAAALRDALIGHDGHRLMVIFARLFAVIAITSFLGALRWLSFALVPEAEWFRLVIGLVNPVLSVGTFVWALLAVRAIVESGGMRRE